jgi:hypothetical protein
MYTPVGVAHWSAPTRVSERVYRGYLPARALTPALTLGTAGCGGSQVAAIAGNGAYGGAVCGAFPIASREWLGFVAIIRYKGPFLYRCHWIFAKAQLIPLLQLHSKGDIDWSQ